MIRYMNGGAIQEVMCDGCNGVWQASVETLRPWEEYLHDWYQVRTSPFSPPPPGIHGPLWVVQRFNFCSVGCIAVWSSYIEERHKTVDYGDEPRLPSVLQENTGSIVCADCNYPIHSEKEEWVCACSSGIYPTNVSKYFTQRPLTPRAPEE